MNRRSALKNMLLFAAAPAIIKIDTLMPVKPMVNQATFTVDGWTTDKDGMIHIHQKGEMFIGNKDNYIRWYHDGLEVKGSLTDSLKIREPLTDWESKEQGDLTILGSKEYVMDKEVMVRVRTRGDKYISKSYIKSIG
jgi:hypothetical protein